MFQSRVGAAMMWMHRRRTVAQLVGTTALRPTLALFAVLLLAACASDPPPGGPPGPGPGPGDGRAPGRPSPRSAGACARVFSSPHGEPFRGKEGDAACPMRIWFDQADADHDGALTRGEFRNDALRFFRTLDVNSDGVIGPGELQRYERVIFPEIAFGDHPGPQAALQTGLLRVAYAGQLGGGGMGGQPGGGGGGGGGGRHGGGKAGGDHAGQRGGDDGGSSSQGAGRFGLLAEPEPVSAADLNFDGRISQAEFATRADQRFDDLDAAQTGRLTYADIEARMAVAHGGRDRRRRPPQG